MLGFRKKKAPTPSEDDLKKALREELSHLIRSRKRVSRSKIYNYMQQLNKQSFTIRVDGELYNVWYSSMDWDVKTEKLETL